MNTRNTSVMTLQNDCSAVALDLYGGSITDFHLLHHNINPLSFSYPPEQMPQNNRAGAAYKGHFLCLGRWGQPSAGEIKKGVPHHGQFANMRWNLQHQSSNLQAYMDTFSEMESLSVKREIILDNLSPVLFVQELVENTAQLGRLYNMVQHPTIAAPFLDEHTVIDSNATEGFNQLMYKSAAANTINWETPFLKNKHTEQSDDVTSFIINPEEVYGWITAYSPTHNLVLGYVWRRKNYPWLHIWQHRLNEAIQYLGMEFGTAGIHQPFPEIINTATSLFNEKTLDYIDAGEIVNKAYASFIFETDQGFGGVENINITNGKLHIKAKQKGTGTLFNLSEKIIYGL